MQNLFSYILGWFLVMFCHVIVVPRLSIMGIYPDIALITIILWALKQGWKAGIWYGFLLGISIGLLDPRMTGWIILLMSMFGFFVGMIREGIYMDSIYFQFSAGMIMTFLFQMIFRFVQGPSFFFDKFFMMFRDSILIAVYTALVGIIGLWIVRERYRLKNLL
jgi:rod shape-determining protein MreD